MDAPLGLPEGQVVEVEVSTVQAVDLEQYGFKPLPAGDYLVTNEMVNRIRETAGF
ncbi:MAG: hypothetical protein OXE87_00905 [Chloroflexi bacterium]|nr:hypothetical protein [Chloroflexota bacterium]